jgi:hypothetical protein
MVQKYSFCLGGGPVFRVETREAPKVLQEFKALLGNSS